MPAKLFFCIVSFIAFFIFTPNVCGDLLASWDVSWEITHDDFARQMALELGCSTSDALPGAESIIFSWNDNSFLYDESDIGSTFSANLSNSSNFSDFSTFITDGSDYYISHAVWVTHFDGGRGNQFYRQESSIIGTSSNSVNGVDLSGYNIESITFTIANLSRNNAGLLPNTSTSALEGTFRINGSAVPEPSTILLFALGGCSAWLLRRNKANKI